MFQHFDRQISGPASPNLSKGGLAVSNVPRNMPPASERSLQASIAANTSWANTVDRTARTAAARAARDAKFTEQAGGDPVRAAHLRTVYFQRLALKSAQARRKARELEAVAEAAEAELAQADDAAA